MRGVDPDLVPGRGLETHEGAGLGAVAMQHVRLQLPDEALKARPHLKIRRVRFTANGQSMNAELEARRDLRQRLLGAFAAGQAVGDDADMVATVGLAVGEIEDMAKDAADGRARRVQDTKRPAIDNGHDQNRRPRRAPMPPAIAGATTMGGYETVTRRIDGIL